MKLRRGAVAAAVLIGAYAAVVRPRLLCWGATAEEAEGRHPGDDVMPGGRRWSTMAVTIDAPARRVWPWLVQMGHGRAGWYSWDRLDNFGARSADSLHPEWQDVAVGDRLLSTPDGTHWFEVAALEPERFLALRASSGARRPAGSPRRPPSSSDSVWCFWLKDLPDERTRLIVSVYAPQQRRPTQALTSFLLWEPVHWFMQTRQFTNLKRRAEGELRAKGEKISGRRSAGAASRRTPAPLPDGPRSGRCAGDVRLRGPGTR